MRRCHCQFISDEVLQRLAADPQLSQEAREQAAHTARLNRLFCDIRDQNLALSGFLQKD